MSGTPSTLAELFAECDARGVRLSLAADGGLAVDGLPAALSPDLLDALRAHKPELLAALKALRRPQGAEGVQPDPEAGPDSASRYRVDPEPLRLDAEGWPLGLIDRDGRPLTLLDPPPADCCCGRMVCPWCDLRGRWRCLACDPPRLTG